MITDVQAQQPKRSIKELESLAEKAGVGAALELSGATKGFGRDEFLDLARVFESYAKWSVAMASLHHPLVVPHSGN